MYVTIRKYADKGGLIAGLVPPVRDRFVPLLRRSAGFKGYCAFASEDGHVVSVTIFGDRLSAMRADAQVREWVVSNLRDLLPNPPETTAGETLLHEISKLRRDGGPAMFATIRMFEGVGPREEVLPLVREHVFLTITGAPGFRGYYAFLDEADTRRGVSVSLFDIREHAIEANARVVSVMRERRIAPSPPRVMAGQVVIIAAAGGWSAPWLSNSETRSCILTQTEVPDVGRVDGPPASADHAPPPCASTARRHPSPEATDQYRHARLNRPDRSHRSRRFGCLPAVGPRT